MLLALASFALADILDVAAFGGVVGVHDSGDVAAGPAFFSLAGESRIWALMGPETDELPVVRSWGISLGGWTPMFIVEAKGREAYEQSKKNVKPGEPPMPPRPESLFDGAPLIEVGGSAWDGERFHASIGGGGLLNLGHAAKIPSTDAYFGPSFGGLTRVRYLQGAEVGEGSVLAYAGLDAGARAGQAALFRLRSAAEVDPFIGELRLVGDVVVGFDMNPVEVPLVIQLRGKGSLDPLSAWAPAGTLTVSVGYATE